MFSVARALVRPATSALRSSSRVQPAALRFSAVRFLTTRYTVDHEWVQLDPATNIGTVGITDYAQKALGDVVFVELPEAGSEVAQGDPIGAVESVKAASDIFAPVSGIVEEINETLSESPSLLNKSPQKDGWLAKIQLSSPAEFEALLSDEAYKAHCEGSEDGGEH
ncbi:putative glycine dehydrogenase [Naematelia encephala]|uniref:Glycine cleavage system H protein n=1 Tax=Naematelia encephala TaxID=71784 RepID=A0A1Y2BCK2_9TREE|nr:putative glycine dehydrogenase [Naematelia encephala]